MLRAFLILILVLFQGLFSLTLKGKVTDTLFSSDSTLQIEVLETGEKIGSKLNQPFTLKLLPDTLWNLCVTDNIQEKCYELTYLGKDTLITLEITDTTQITYQTETTSANSQVTDNVLSDLDTLEVSEAPQEVLTEGVQLKKVLLRLRKVPKRALGKSTVSAKLIKNAPGLAEADVMRSLQNLPGVVASSDFSSKIYVRGGGSDQNLFLFDNGVIFSPVHFFGLFSTFLVEGVESVDFYKGGFSSQYGNRLSSVVDVKAREGGDSTESWASKSSVKISTFASQIHTEGHQNNFRWLTAGRITYLKEVIDALRDNGLIDLNLNYRFWDVQTHLSYDFNEKHKLTFSHYAGRDRLSLTPINIDWGNILAPVNWYATWSDKWKTQTLLAYSKFDQGFSLENIIGFGNGVELLNLKPMAIYTPSSNHEFTFGLEIQDYQIEFTQDIQAAGVEFSDPTDYTLISIFAQHKYILDSYTFNYGFRGNYINTLDEFALEPRLGITKSLQNDKFLDFHLGYYLQYMNTVLFADQETINEFYYPAKKTPFNRINPASNILFSLGYRDESLWEKYFFSLEGYYKSFKDLLVFAPFDVPANIQNDGNAVLGDFFKSGVGYSAGYEFSFRKDEGWYTGGLSFSQGYSVVLEENDSIAYYPKWHQPWSVKLDASMSWKGEEGRKKSKKKNGYFRSSSQLKYANGLPYTEYIGQVPTSFIDQNEYGQQAGGPTRDFEGNINLPRGSRNDVFVKPYFRWDLKPVDIGVENKWNFSWTILNITNYSNVFIEFFDTSQNPPIRQEITQFPFFPILLNYEFYF